MYPIPPSLSPSMSHRFLIACLGALLLAGPAHGQQRGLATGQTDARPADPARYPSLEYGRSRASTGWVLREDGARVAIDEGLEWDGIKVYLSLTWDLVAVDAATNQTLWSRRVSAFWNRISIRELAAGEDAEPAAEGGLVVALRPYEEPDGVDQRVELYRLRTGEKVALAAPVPSGRRLDVVRSFHGPMCRIGAPFQLLVGTKTGAKTMFDEMFGAERPFDLGAVDFEEEVLFVVCAGDSWNCNGFVPVAAYEDDERVLLRYDGLFYQTASFEVAADDEGDGPEELGRSRPYGVFVLPRREKTYVVERDAQNLIGGPSVWKERYRHVGVPSPEEELRALPRDV